jgi:hypothetical protein
MSASHLVLEPPLLLIPHPWLGPCRAPGGLVPAGRHSVSAGGTPSGWQGRRASSAARHGQRQCRRTSCPVPSLSRNRHTRVCKPEVSWECHTVRALREGARTHLDLKGYTRGERSDIYDERVPMSLIATHPGLEAVWMGRTLQLEHTSEPISEAPIIQAPKAYALCNRTRRVQDAQTPLQGEGR